MSLRPLVIDDEAREKVRKVLDYASRPEHRFRLLGEYKSSQQPPGNNYRHCTTLDTYRCVFSVTEVSESNKRFRHLSISIPSQDKYANPFAAFTIAQLFGFEGWDGKTVDRLPPTWAGHVDKNDGCIVLAQEIQSC